jgi:hypothetical protein
MIEKNKCACCKNVYEIMWDDETDDYYSDSIENDDDSICEDEQYPEYCPFCGVHREYGGEEDGYDSFNDK